MGSLDEVPVEKDEVADPLPSELNIGDFNLFLEASKDKLTVRYTGQAQHENDVGCIQSNHPVPRKRLVYYFEVTVKEASDRGEIGIGFSDKNFKMGRHPGWEPNSYGYKGDSGKKHANCTRGEEYGPPFGAGDTIGAGFHLGRQEVFFTKNGKQLGVAFKGVTVAPLFPTIGLHSQSDCIEVNFGKEPFRFDVEALVQDEREQQQAAVHSAQIPPADCHQIVRNYLLHYGYADTLAAFDQGAGAVGEASGTVLDRVEDGPEAANLGLRKRVRQHMVRGEVEAAQTILEGMGLTQSSWETHFHTSCQRYIELIRSGRISEAVQFAQSTLSGLRGHSPELDEVLHNVVALIAYEDPLDSPLRHLLSMGQREVVADVVNGAMLAAASGDGAGTAPQAVLERLLQQLVAVHHEARACNGHQGEVFRLKDHLVGTGQKGKP